MSDGNVLATGMTLELDTVTVVRTPDDGIAVNIGTGQRSRCHGFATIDAARTFLVRELGVPDGMIRWVADSATTKRG